MVIHDATIAADAGRSMQFGAAIAVDGDRIVAIGPSGEVLSRFPDAERIEGRGKLVLPGFANCHTHFTLTLQRGIEEDFSFPSTLRLPRSPSEYLSEEERVIMAQLGALEALRSGTTAVMEIGRGIETYAQALVETGLRLVLAETAADLDQPRAAREGIFEFEAKRGEEGLQRITELHERWHGTAEGRVTVAVAAHAPESVSPELLRRMRGLQEDLDTIATIHLNQSWWEVEAVKRERGVLPTEYLAQNDYLHDRLVAGHCRCITTREISLLGRAGVSVSFNAAIAARRGFLAPVLELEAAGCTIALGSDNMAEDMVEVMRTGMFMERVRRGDGERPLPEDVLVWATTNGYHALGLEEAGSLRAGEKADLIVIDTRRPHLVPTTRIVSSFVHQGQAGDVESVMVDGRWLMRDGEVLTMDERTIVREAERIGRRAWRSLLEEHPALELPITLDISEPRDR